MIGDLKIGRRGVKAPLYLVPMWALEGPSRVFDYGARKYALGNWVEAAKEGEPANALSDYLSAAVRHWGKMQRAGGGGIPNWQALDPESGLPHLDHLITSLIMLRGIAQIAGMLEGDPGRGNDPPAKAEAVRDVKPANPEGIEVGDRVRVKHFDMSAFSIYGSVMEEQQGREFTVERLDSEGDAVLDIGYCYHPQHLEKVGAVSPESEASPPETKSGPMEPEDPLSEGELVRARKDAGLPYRDSSGAMRKLQSEGYTFPLGLVNRLGETRCPGGWTWQIEDLERAPAFVKPMGPAPRVYVAGPMTKGDLMAHVRHAAKVAGRIADAGGVPFVPQLSVLWELVEPRDYEDWMRIDFAWIEACDCLLRIDGESSGADREVEHAKANGIPVFAESELDALIDRIKGEVDRA